MTATLKPKTMGNGAAWAWDAIGPGTGIQLTVGAHRGWLVVPALHRNIYSVDHGKTWQVQRLVDKAGKYQEGTSEGTVVELTDGRLLRNDRAVGSVWDTSNHRWVARGTIPGSFDTFAPDKALIDPKAEGSTLRYNTTSPARIEFLNSASINTRTKMTVRISYDDGKSWRFSRSLNDARLPKPSVPGWSGLGTGAVAEGGYSSLAKTADYFTAALVEVNEDTGTRSSHRSIVFRTFNLPWILNGREE
jgi:sialidase-1